MSVRKIFSIIIASIALYLFINMFFPYNGLISKYNDIAIIDGNMWSFSIGFSIFAVISILGIITVYLLHLFGIANEKWVSFANFGTGYLTIFHICYLFLVMDSTKIGIWLGAIFSLILLVLSVLWYFLNDSKPEPKQPKGKVTGYDPKTGEPIYAKPKGFNPKTGEPIYE